MVLFKIKYITSFILLIQYFGVLASGEIPDNSNKPAIHTYISIEENQNVSDIIAKDEQLKLWSNAWIDAGFEPIILTTREASEHPIYQDVLSRLSTANVDKKQWGRYLRYIVMSQIGGWYADPVILPFGLNDGGTLPYDGKFVIHEGTGRAELMSGSKSEWERMASIMLENPTNDDNELLKLLLQKDPQLFMIEDSTTNALHLLKGTGVDVCGLASSRKLTAAKFQSRIGILAGIPRRNYYDASHASLLSVFRRCKIDEPEGAQKYPFKNWNDSLNMSGPPPSSQNVSEKPTQLLSANQDSILNMLRGNNVDNPVNPSAQQFPSNNQNDLLSTLGLPSSNQNTQDNISNYLRGNNVDTPINPSSQQLPSNNQNDILNMLGLSNNANAPDNTIVQQAPSNSQNDVLKMLGVLPNTVSQPQTRQPPSDNQNDILNALGLSNNANTPIITNLQQASSNNSQNDILKMLGVLPNTASQPQTRQLLPAINQNGASDLLGLSSNNAYLPNDVNAMQFSTNNQNDVLSMLGLSTNNN